MPIIQMTMVEGRDSKVVEDCMKKVAQTVSESLDAPLSSIRVVVNEVPASRFAVGTTLKSEQK